MLTMTYAGKTSEEMGLKILSMPTRTRAAQRGNSLEVSGRHGDLWSSDGTLQPYDQPVRASARQSRLNGIMAWITGAGDLVFSDAPTLVIPARADQEVRCTRVTNDSDPLYRVEFTFTCQPFFYVAPPAADIEITASGTALTNPYTMESMPRIKVFGNGDITLNVGRHTVFLTEVQTAIVLDSELLDAFTADETELANSQMDGAFPTLDPGAQYISWTGAVTKVVITPRWRCF